LTRSDSCENFFSKVGGMSGMERAYDFHELARAANTMNQLSEVEYDENGSQFGRVHNKMTNIWAKLHPLESRELKADLGDYTLVGTDDLLVEAMKEGLLEAQKMLRSLNMAPSAVAKQKKWLLNHGQWSGQMPSTSHTHLARCQWQMKMAMLSIYGTLWRYKRRMQTTTYVMITAHVKKPS
jgi:hypothetical protein